MSSKQTNPWWVAFVSGMASYIDAVAIVGTGIALTVYHESVGLGDGHVGVLSSTLTVFIAIGALIGGRLGDTYGRKHVFMVTMGVIMVGALILIFGTQFPVLVAGIALMGLGAGADLPVSLATIAETAPDESRGKMVSFSQILWTVGIITAGLAGTAFGNMGRLGGQLMFAHVGLAAVLVFLMRFSIPESRMWIEARERRLAGGESAHREDTRSQLGTLFRSPYAILFVALIVFYAFTNVGVNTFGQFGTYMMVTLGGVTPSLASAVFTGCSVFGILLTFLFMKCVDTKWRMPLFYFGAVCGVVALLVPVALGFTKSPIFAQTVLVFIFNGLAFEAMMKVWTQESFPTLLRTTAQGTIIAAARFLAAAVGAVTPTLLAASPSALFLGLTGLMVIGLGFAIVVFARRRTTEFQREEELELTPAGV